jgi:hypothetical protein
MNLQLQVVRSSLLRFGAIRKRPIMLDVKKLNIFLNWELELKVVKRLAEQKQLRNKVYTQQSLYGTKFRHNISYT